MPKATKLPSGKWRCRAYYTDFDGSYKTKSFTANTKKEAERLSATFVMEHEHNAKPENKTLGALADAYIENRSELLSPSTIAGYKKIRNSAFKEIINVRIGIITKEMYQSAINTYSKGRAPKTVASANAFFSSVLKANGYNLSEGVILPQKENKEIQIPSEAEVSAFLENIAPTRIYLYCLFAATLGLRKSEIVALRWKDIDTKAKTIHITKAIVPARFARPFFRIYHRAQVGQRKAMEKLLLKVKISYVISLAELIPAILFRGISVPRFNEQVACLTYAAVALYFIRAAVACFGIYDKEIYVFAEIGGIACQVLHLIF